MRNSSFNKDFYEGNTGKVMLELGKTYKGDSRFQLDDRFKDDIQVDKLPEKFKQIAEKGVIENIKKTKPIKKQKPLIIQRFEPGTKKAQLNVKKAEGQKKYIEGVKKHELKKKKKQLVQKGIDKIKKADRLLGISNSATNANTNAQGNKPKFSITVTGNRAQAFVPNEFRLFE